MLLTLPLALLLSAALPAAARPDAFEDELDAYRRLAKHPSLFRRLLAQENLAGTRDARALDVLVRDYARLPEPRDQAQYLLAAVCGRHFDGATFVPALQKWRNKFARPEHAWLWYQTLLIQARHQGPAELLELAGSKRKHAFLRAMAVEALAALRRPEAVTAVSEVLGTLPSHAPQRAALLNAIATVLLSRGHEDGSTAHHALARRLIDLLDDPATPESSKVVIARHLQRVFDVGYAFLEAAPWRQVLASVQSLMEIPPLRGRQVLPVELSGIQARGMRIVYVVDLSSGAMVETTAADEDVLAGGTGQAVGPGTAGEIRLTAMRQALRASMEALSPEQSFAVIYHRHLDSGLAPECKGMMPATPRNVADVLDGLRRIVPSADSDLHAGLRAAFAVTEKGLTQKPEYVDADALMQGADTIFVLSQSGPVRDSWVAAGEPESDPPHWSGEGREVRGVYSDEDRLAEELQRWNLLRKAEIHAVAVGDAPRQVFHDLFRPYRGWNTLRGTEARAADEDAATQTFASVQQQYEAYLQRPSLFMRMRGRRRLAMTGDLRALDLLARSYAHPESPRHRVPHLLASLCARHFAAPEYLPRFHGWREERREPKDAWLWYRTALLDLEHGDASAVETRARTDERHYLRLAAIRAIAAERGPNCVPLAAELLANLPAEGPERASMLEAIAALLEARGHLRTAEDFAAPAEALIGHLRDAELPRRTRHVIARHLASIFRTDMGHGLDADLWLRELKGAQAAPDEPEEPPDAYVPFEFIGIPSGGGRVCYVIDASDSMLEPISDKERRRLSRVVTGTGSPEADRDALPWDKIHNRFDVAREYLKLSLRRLTEDKSFAIVLFGTDAELLASTPSLTAATPAAVRKAIRDLDAMEPGPEVPGRPHGTLMGFTNMHGGLDLAFRITGEGLGPLDPYVDPTMLAEGADTIFLLSDGDPSTDDYRAVDRPDTGDVQADPETRAEQEKVPDVTFYGPYVDYDGFLVDDVRRMNLFRNVEIHCIGIGEANMQLLRDLASAGLGEVRDL
ncbi:MAG: hypothetical protein ACYTG6_04515 [Planctomycetota bacterium]